MPLQVPTYAVEKLEATLNISHYLNIKYKQSES